MIIGSTAGFKYATTCEKPLPHFVNVSGRYKMNDNQIYKNRPEIGEALDRQVKKSTLILLTAFFILNITFFFIYMIYKLGIF